MPLLFRLGSCLSFLLCVFHLETQALVPSSITNMWDGEISQNSSMTVIKTAGNGEPSMVRWELKEPTNLNRQFIEVWLQLGSFENWFAIEVRVSADANFSTYASFPISRYSDQDFNWLQENSLRKVTLSLGQAVNLENVDATKIKYIAVYAQDMGTAPMNLQVSAPKVLPAKSRAVVSLTFDDGDASHFTAAEIMYRHGLRGTAYIMAREIDKPGFLTLEQLNIMQNKMGWGLSGHHATPLTNMSPDQLQEEMVFEIDFLNKLGAFDAALHFAYPLGKTNSNLAIPQTRQFYSTARRAADGAETLPPADWHLLRAVNIMPSVSPQWLKERIQTAQAQGEWLIFMFHKIVPGAPNSDLEYNVEEFEKIMEVIQETQVEVLPIHEVYESQKAQGL